MVKCTKCYAINKPEAKFCGSCGQTLGSSGSSGKKTGVKPSYSPPARSSPVRPSYSPPVRDTSIKPSYNLPARVTAPSMPAVTKSTPSMELSKKWSSDGEEEDNFALSTIEEKDFFVDITEEKKDSYSVDTVEAEEKDAYLLTADLKKEESPADIREERRIEQVETKSPDGNIINNLFSGNKNLMEMFIIQEIMSPPKFKRRKG